MSGELTGDLISNWINFKLYPESVGDSFFSPDILLSCVPSGYLCVGPKEVGDFLKYFFNQTGPEFRVEIVASKMDIQENFLIEDIKVTVTPLRSTLPWLFSSDISTDLSTQKFTYELKMTLQFYENALVKVKLDWDQKLLEEQIKTKEPLSSSDFQTQADSTSVQTKESDISSKVEPSSDVSTNPHIPGLPALVDEKLPSKVEQASTNNTVSKQEDSQSELQAGLLSDKSLIKPGSPTNSDIFSKENISERKALEKINASELDTPSVTEISENTTFSEKLDFSGNETSKNNNLTENVASTAGATEKSELPEDIYNPSLPLVQSVPLASGGEAAPHSVQNETPNSNKNNPNEKGSSPDVEQAEVNTLVDSEGSIHEPTNQESPNSQSPLPKPSPASKPKEAVSLVSSKAKCLNTTTKKLTSTATPTAKSQPGSNKDVQPSQNPPARTKSHHRSVTATPMSKSQSSPNKDATSSQKPLTRGLSHHRSLTASPFTASRRPMSRNSYNPSETRSKHESRTLLPIPPLGRNRKFDTRRLESQIDFSDGSSAPTSPLSPKLNLNLSSPSSENFVSRTPRNPLAARNLQTSFSIGAENSNLSSSQSSQIPAWANELRPYLKKGSTGFKI